jgi:peptidoglycan/LPS O-acetylase OafA/YrhL
MVDWATQTMSALTRNRSLDVLRGVAVLLVFGVHFPYYGILHAGWIGLDLFFVLSGFLISGLLFKDYREHGRIRLKRFMFRRAMKIWPPLYVFLGVIGVFIWRDAHSFPSRSFLASALFYRNYMPGVDEPIVIGHTWSLAVEEHFYLLLPLLLILLAYRNRKSSDPFASIPIIFAVLAPVSLAMRFFANDVTATHLRLDGLFAGVTLRYLYDFKPHLFEKLRNVYAAAATVTIAFLIFAYGTPRLKGTIGLTAAYLGFGLLLAWAISKEPVTKAGRFMVNAIAAIGVYSYSIYLWHVPVIFLFRGSWGQTALSFWSALAASLLVGIAMAKLVELPALRLRDKIETAVGPKVFDAVPLKVALTPALESPSEEHASA